MRQSKFYFENLDAIRFIAALMVIVQHAVLASLKLVNDGTVIRKTLFMFGDGGSGVSIFFVLSGFLITYTLMHEHQETGKVSLKNFYTRRVLRIWPLFFAVVAYSFLIYPGLKTIIGMNNPLPSRISYQLAFLSNFDVINLSKHFPGSNAMSQDITWSVSIEEQFYLIWPLIFVFLPRRLWLSGITGIIVLSITFRLLNNNDEVVLYFHTLSNLVDLAMGGLYAWAVLRISAVKVFFQNTGSLILGLSIVLVTILLFFRYDIFLIPYGSTIFKMSSTLIFGFIISSQALTASGSTFELSRLGFATKWGKYTYGMYLMHPIFLTLLLVVYRLLHINPESFVPLCILTCLTLFLTMLMSWISYNFFEMKFLKIKSRFV